MFPKVYFSPQYFADVYWEPLSGGAPPVTYTYFVMFEMDD